MTRTEFEKWIRDNAESVTDYHANRIDYKFATLREPVTVPMQRIV